ncbi:hypothetical protein GCM10022211_25210 [Sphingomonas humi]|uniref:Uncharacterized protein n=2 Tax=Sphingomonas humi TaxID=335630 RepID=A0ABP7SCJ7_9SPHN
MTMATLFVVGVALLCAVISAWAVLRIIQAGDLAWKPLWLIGSLFGVIGFGLDPRAPGHLFFHVGFQIPVVMGVWSSAGGLLLKALFPPIALVALVKIEAPVRR